MSLQSLQWLIAGARVDHPCSQGHDWRSEGGRGCPKDLTEGCSQTVYRCARCGDYDYGEKGGPGDADCRDLCKHKE